MATRTVRAHTKVRGKVSVKSYKQKYKKDRGPSKGKRKVSLRNQTRTDWLKDDKGEFVGRAGKDGKTSAKKYSMKGKDYTGAIMDSMGRIQGRYESAGGKKRYTAEMKKIHPK